MVFLSFSVVRFFDLPKIWFSLLCPPLLFSTDRSKLFEYTDTFWWLFIHQITNSLNKITWIDVMYLMRVKEFWFIHWVQLLVFLSHSLTFVFWLFLWCDYTYWQQRKYVKERYSSRETCEIPAQNRLDRDLYTHNVHFQVTNQLVSILYVWKVKTMFVQVHLCDVCVWVIWFDSI